MCCFSHLEVKMAEPEITGSVNGRKKIKLTSPWRRGLVIDTWFRDQKVQGSSPGCARLTLSLEERLFTYIFSPHSFVKRVFDYAQYARLKRHLYDISYVILHRGLRKIQWLKMACRKYCV